MQIVCCYTVNRFMFSKIKEKSDYVDEFCIYNLKARKILRKSQPNFQHYVTKIEVQAKKNGFPRKKRVLDIQISCMYFMSFVTVHLTETGSNLVTKNSSERF